MNFYEIPLNANPAQEFSVIIGTEKLDFKLKFSGDYTYMDFTLNDNPIFISELCKSAVNLLKQYRSSGALGALIFLTDSDDYPKWENFGTKDRLYYVVG